MLMRNIAQHPVTQGEKLAALDQAMSRELSRGSIGSIVPAALASIRAEIMKSSLSATDIAIPFIEKLISRHNALFDMPRTRDTERAHQQTLQESELMFRQLERLLATRRTAWLSHSSELPNTPRGGPSN